MSVIIGANDIKVGNVLKYDGKLCIVLSRDHVRTGKGGAYVSGDMKDLGKGNKFSYRMNSKDNVERGILDSVICQFSYKSDDVVTLLDQDYETVEVPLDLFDDKHVYLVEGIGNVVIKYNDEIPVMAEIPEKVILEVVDTQVSMKGQTITSSYKPAKLSNGINVGVPPFINVGDKIVVNTVTGEYVERAKK